MKNGKIDGGDNADLEGNFEKILKNQIEIFWICNNVCVERKDHKIVKYKKSYGSGVRFHSRSEGIKHIFRWFEGLSKVKIKKNYYFGKY